jgi:replicative DNA helicase
MKPTYSDERLLYETQAIGTLLRYPRWLGRVDEKAFHVPHYKEMYKDLKELNSQEKLHASIFYNKKNEDGTSKYSEFSVTALADWIERHAPKEEEQAEAMLNVVRIMIQADDYGVYVQDAMKQAYKDVQVGHFHTAVNTLKSIRYQNYEGYDDLKTVMLNSVKESNGFKSGIATIDEYTGGWYLGNLMSIAGDTGTQKTRSSLWLLIQILKANPTFKAVYFEKEMPIKDIGRLCVAYFFNVKNDDIIRATAEQRKQIEEVIEKFSEREDFKQVIERLTVISPNEFSTVADMWRIVEETKANVWVLDYMSLLDGDSTTSSDKAYTVMSNAKKLKDMVHQTGTFGIILNQLNKRTVEGRHNKIPMLDDIEWSSDIKKLSAYVLATFYPSQYYPTLNPSWFFLVSLKNRDKKNYYVPLLCHPEYSRFEEHRTEQSKQLADLWMQDYVSTFESKT